MSARKIWMVSATRTIQIDWIGSWNSRLKLPLVTSTTTRATPPTMAMVITQRHRTTGVPTPYDARMSDVRYEVTGAVARATIDRPERRNAMSFGVMPGRRSRRRKPTTTCGCSCSRARGRRHSAPAPTSGVAGSQTGHRPRTTVGGCSPTCSAISGTSGSRRSHESAATLAGGFGLALACDFVVAAEDAQFGTPEVNVGLWPYMITVPLLRSMPPKRARADDDRTAGRCRRGRAHRVRDAGRAVAELDGAVDELAATLSSKSPLILRWGRESFYRVLDMDPDDALAYLQAMLTVTSASEDTAEGVAAFAEKREPKWKGR